MPTRPAPRSGWFWINLLLLVALYIYDAASAVKPNGHVPLSSILFSVYDIFVVLSAARGGCFSRGLFWINTALCTLAMLLLAGGALLLPESEVRKFGAHLLVGSLLAVIAVWLLHVTFLFQLRRRT